MEKSSLDKVDTAFSDAVRSCTVYITDMGSMLETAQRHALATRDYVEQTVQKVALDAVALCGPMMQPNIQAWQW